MKPKRYSAYASLPLLLLGDAKTPLELVLVNASTYSVFSFIVGVVGWGVSGVSQVTTSRYTALQRTAITMVAVSAAVYVLAFCMAAMLVLGRQAGHTNPITQVLYTLGRVLLFVLLPCLLITFAIIGLALLTGNAPAFTGSH